MAIKLYKPTTASRRKMSVTDYSLLNAKKPHKRLTKILKRSFGRDVTGQISVRHKGGGAKRKYRSISDLTKYLGQKAIVQTIEYDPNRSAFICLVKIGEDKIYLLAWEGLKVGDEVISGDKVDIKPGNRMRLKAIPTGVNIHDIEIYPGQGGRLIKSAGNQSVIMSKDSPWVQVKLPSGETRKVNENSFASIGQVSNLTHSFIRIGKAGRNRWKGIRPSVRGKAMAPNAHPHGGGEGVNPIGLKYPKTPWGKIAIGGKTRKKNKYSDKMIVSRRK